MSIRTPVFDKKRCYFLFARRPKNRTLTYTYHRVRTPKLSAEDRHPVGHQPHLSPIQVRACPIPNFHYVDLLAQHIPFHFFPG